MFVKTQIFKNENRPLEKISTHYLSGHSGEKYRFMTKIPQVMTSALKMNSRILLLRRKKIGPISGLQLVDILVQE